ncbi:hypothetical protein D3C86_1380830 [compost metagenome]
MGSSFTRWQATKCSAPMSLKAGSAVLQMSFAKGQRVWKRQPEGGLTGLGMSPWRMMRSLRTVGSGMGTAESSAWV